MRTTAPLSAPSRNRLDFFVLVVSLFGTSIQAAIDAKAVGIGKLVFALKIQDALRVLRMLRMLRVMRHFRAIHRMIKTLIISAPAIWNVGMLISECCAMGAASQGRGRQGSNSTGTMCRSGVLHIRLCRHAILCSASRRIIHRLPCQLP